MWPAVLLRDMEPRLTQETETKLSPPLAEEVRGRMVGHVRVSCARCRRSLKSLMNRSPILFVDMTHVNVGREGASPEVVGIC